MTAGARPLDAVCWKGSWLARRRVTHAACTDAAGHLGACLCPTCGAVIAIRPTKPAPSLEQFYEEQLDPEMHPDVRRRLAGWRADAHRKARVRERERQEQLDYEGRNDEVKDWARWLGVRVLVVLFVTGGVTRPPAVGVSLLLSVGCLAAALWLWCGRRSES